MTAATWRAPEAADDNQPSVEVLELPGGAVGLRVDDAPGLHLVIPAAAWADLVAAVKGGQFDPPAATPRRPAAPETQRVRSRTNRTACRWPRKDAYNPEDPAEARLAARRTRPGMALYLCGCGWHHLGNLPIDPKVPAAPIPRVDLEPGEGGPIAWAQQRRRVTLVTGQGQVHAVGEVLAYIDAPTVQVRLADGRVIPWRLDLTVPASD
jgi:hypothetical protein